MPFWYRVSVFGIIPFWNHVLIGPCPSDTMYQYSGHIPTCRNCITTYRKTFTSYLDDYGASHFSSLRNRSEDMGIGNFGRHEPIVFKTTLLYFGPCPYWTIKSFITLLDFQSPFGGHGGAKWLRIKIVLTADWAPRSSADLEPRWQRRYPG